MKTIDRPAPDSHEMPTDKAPDNQPPKQEAPVTATEPPEKGKSSKDKKADAKKKRLALMIGIPVLLVAGIIGFRHYKWSQWHVSTDDAYTTSDVIQVTPQVNGRIEKLLVSDNQQVKKGQLLAVLDPSSYEVAVENAKANLAVAIAAKNAAQRQVELTGSTGAAQVSQAQGGIEQAQGGIGAAQAGVAQGDAGIQNARAAIATARDTAKAAQTDIASAQAGRDRAIQAAKAAQTQIASAQARAQGTGAGVGQANANLKAQVAARARAIEAVRAAQADVKTAQSGVAASRAQIDVAQSAIDTAQAQLVKANEDLKRQQMLYEGGAAPRANVEAARAAQKTAGAQLDGARAQLAAAGQNLAQAQSFQTAKEAAVESARAGVRAADAQIAASRAQLEAARAGASGGAPDVANARAQYAAAQGAVREAEAKIASERAQTQAAADQIAQAQASLANAQATKNAAQQQVDVAKGKASQAQGTLQEANTGDQQVSVAQANFKSALAKVSQAQAALKQAQLDLDRTQIRSSVDGTVSRRSGQVGQQVAPGQALMALVPLNDVWLVANFKETQMASIRVGQEVDIELDALAKDHFKGHVQSLAAGNSANSAVRAVARRKRDWQLHQSRPARAGENYLRSESARHGSVARGLVGSADGGDEIGLFSVAEFSALVAPTPALPWLRQATTRAGRGSTCWAPIGIELSLK